MIVTTDGSICFAAAATVPSSFGVVDAGVFVTLIGEPAVGFEPLTQAYDPMPAPAPITADSDAATSTAARFRLGRTAVAVAEAPVGGSGGTPAGAGKSCGAKPGTRSIGTVGSDPP